MGTGGIPSIEFDAWGITKEYLTAIGTFVGIGVAGEVAVPLIAARLAPVAVEGAAALETAQAARSAGASRGVAAEMQVGETVVTDVSTSIRARGPLNPSLEKVVAATKGEPGMARWHGECAEIGCLNQLLNQGVNPAGGRSYAIDLRNMMLREACPSCQRILEIYKVTPKQ